MSQGKKKKRKNNAVTQSFLGNLFKLFRKCLYSATLIPQIPIRVFFVYSVLSLILGVHSHDTVV